MDMILGKCKFSNSFSLFLVTYVVDTQHRGNSDMYLHYMSFQ